MDKSQWQCHWFKNRQFSVNVNNSKMSNAMAISISLPISGMNIQICLQSFPCTLQPGTAPYLMCSQQWRTQGQMWTSLMESHWHPFTMQLATTPCMSSSSWWRRVPTWMLGSTGLDRYCHTFCSNRETGIQPSIDSNRSRNPFFVQKPFGSWKIGHWSERFCVLFLLGGTEREMSKKLGRRGIRQSSGAFVLKNPSVHGRS